MRLASRVTIKKLRSSHFEENLLFLLKMCHLFAHFPFYHQNLDLTFSFNTPYPNITAILRPTRHNPHAHRHTSSPQSPSLPQRLPPSTNLPRPTRWHHRDGQHDAHGHRRCWSSRIPRRRALPCRAQAPWQGCTQAIFWRAPFCARRCHNVKRNPATVSFPFPFFCHSLHDTTLTFLFPFFPPTQMRPCCARRRRHQRHDLPSPARRATAQYTAAARRHGDGGR